ncbi:MAG: hypothetical protein B6245_02620 [Desulfobacteraceae bacterium 4572_88]|nr:MAG: hypothetical protein B6245_02620 [Desulfobacteraceae bacterium 4572_88]
MDEVKARPFAPLYHKVVAETITMNYEYQQIRKSGSLDPKCPLCGRDVKFLPKQCQLRFF